MNSSNIFERFYDHFVTESFNESRGACVLYVDAFNFSAFGGCGRSIHPSKKPPGGGSVGVC